MQRFRSLTAICSWWISSGQSLRPVLGVDGSGLESRIGGTLIACVALSAANNIVPLGLLFTSAESSDTVMPFMGQLRRLYPAQQFVISDSGRAFEAGADAAQYLCHGGCSWHVRQKNARSEVMLSFCCVWALICQSLVSRRAAGGAQHPQEAGVREHYGELQRHSGVGESC